MAKITLLSQFKPEGIDKALREFKKLETTGEKVGFALEQAFVPATAALGGLAVAGGAAVKIAAEDAAQQEDLARQLEATTGATDAQIAAVENWISQIEMAAAVSDNELRPAFENIVRSTEDITAAQDAMGLALDIAAGSGKDLETVSEALAEALQGNAAPLAELDKSLVGMIDNGATADEVMAALGDTFKGAAGRQANTAAGQMKKLQLQFENVAENVGKILLPLLEALAPILATIADFAAENSTALTILGGVIGTVAAAVVAYNLYQKAMAAYTAASTAAMAAFNAVMALNPVVLVVAAIVALVAALVIAYKKVGWFRDLVDGAFSAIKTAVSVAVDVIVAAFDLWKLQFELAWAAIEIVADQLIDKFDAIWTTVEDVVGWIKDAWDGLVEFVTGLPGRMLTATAGLFDGIKEAFRTAINWIIGKWNALEFTVPGFSAFGKSFGGFTIGVPDITPLADGGLVTGPTLALVGEAGPELVVPLDRAGAMGNTYNVTVNMPAGADGQSVLDALRQVARRQGSVPIPVSGAVRL